MGILIPSECENKSDTPSIFLAPVAGPNHGVMSIKTPCPDPELYCAPNFHTTVRFPLHKPASAAAVMRISHLLPQSPRFPPTHPFLGRSALQYSISSISTNLAKLYFILNADLKLILCFLPTTPSPMYFSFVILEV